MPLIWIGLIVAFLFIVPILPQTGTIGQFLIGEVVKGSRVGAKSTFNKDAPTEIAENPDDLAASANLDLQTYTLARVISSEEGNSPVYYWAAIASATLNNSIGGDVFSYATDGSFGRQGVGRPVATSEDPYDGHVRIAQAAINGQIADPTQGATQWVAPRTQDILHLRDPSKYKSFAEVDASRIAAGKKRVTPDGIDPKLLVFYA